MTLDKTISLNPKYLILMLTSRCNLRCVYCYHGAIEKNETMKKETIRNAISMAAEHNKHFHLQITGGEPFLVPDLIEYAAKTALELCPQSFIGIQTNGSLFNENLITMIKRYRIQVGISMDAPFGINDRLRGKSNEVLKGMNLLEKHGIPFRITTVVSKANTDVLYQLVLLLSHFSFARGIGLDLLIEKGGVQKKNDIEQTTPYQLKAGLFKMMEAFSYISKYRTQRFYLREIETIKDLMVRDAPPFFCFADKKQSLAVTPDGALYPCTQTINDRSFYMGTLLEQQYPEISLPHYGLRADQSYCRNCPFQLKCPKDCSSRQYYNHGHKDFHGEEKPLSCVMYQSLFEWIQSSPGLNKVK